jgi:hypothetical protein
MAKQEHEFFNDFNYMTNDEYKNLIKKHMNELNISYTTEKRKTIYIYIYIYNRKQIKQFENENKIKYEQGTKTKVIIYILYQNSIIL